MLEKLRTAADFERVRKEGARWRGRYCALNAARALSLIAPDDANNSPETNAEITRVGYITSKRVGGAVVRNRARRLMREAIRSLKTQLPAGWDFVLIAQTGIAERAPRMQEVRDEIWWLINKTTQVAPPRAQRPVDNTDPDSSAD